MARSLSKEEKKFALKEFNSKYRPNLTASLLSDSFKRRVVDYNIEPIGVKEDGKVIYLKANIDFGDAAENRFWKLFLDWGSATALNRASSIYRNVFIEKNEEDYLRILGKEGFAPKYDFTHHFKTNKSGVKKINRLISMEYYDMNLIDFIAPYSKRLSELRMHDCPDLHEISSLETTILNVFKMALNIGAFNDAIINTNNDHKRSALIKKIKRTKISYKADLMNFMNAISSQMFAEQYETGSEWDDEFGAKIEFCIDKDISEPLAAFPELETIHNVRFHPENVLINETIQTCDLLNFDTSDLSSLIKGERCAPYTHIAVTDYRAAKTSPAFSFSSLIEFTPVSGMDIGLTSDMKKALMNHALFVDYSLTNKELCTTDSAPLKDVMPAHLKQREAATMYYLLFETYMLVMCSKGEAFETDEFKDRMHRKVEKMKEIKGEHGSFEIIGEAFQYMHTFIFGKNGE